jgi:O-antigen/teichoic acid export membrane protein
MAKLLNGFSLIVAATVVAGAAGYLVTFLVYREVGPAAYALFAVFWAALYLVVGGLSGIQQEVARATHQLRIGPALHPGRARNFAVAATAIVFVVVVATAPLWASAIFRHAGWSLVWPLAVATGSYVVVATIGGSVNGLGQWGALSLMIAVDGVLRLAFLLICTALTHDVVALAWTVALPFPLTILLLWPFLRRGLVGRSELDVGYRALTWNVTRSVVASVSTAVLVSGFPLLLGITTEEVDPKFVGELIFTITLARAPLVVTVMSLQGFFVVKFRDAREDWWISFWRIQAMIFAGAVILSVLGWWLGPSVFEWISGRSTQIGGDLLAVLVASSALVAALVVSASAVLARSAHFVYSLGWVVAAVVTLIVMFTPIEIVPRVELSLLLGPTAGLAMHASWLASRPRIMTGRRA